VQGLLSAHSGSVLSIFKNNLSFFETEITTLWRNIVCKVNFKIRSNVFENRSSHKFCNISKTLQSAVMQFLMAHTVVGESHGGHTPAIYEEKRM